MKNNLFKSITVGCALSVGLGTTLFVFTKLEVLELAALVAFFLVAAISIAGCILEELSVRRSSKRMRKKSRSIPFITLDADEWYSRYKTTA